MSVKEYSMRSVLNKATLIEPDFWTAYYLDAYSQKPLSALNHSTAERILKIKKNAVDLLRKHLAMKRPLRDVVSVGRLCEPYVEAEERYELTRGLLEALSHYKYPVHLQTSSDMILRDVDILEKIASETFLHLSIIMHPEHTVYKHLYTELEHDPLEVIKKLRRALPTVHISVIISPLIPSIADSLSELEALLKSLRFSGASSVHASLIEDLNEKQTQSLLDILQSDTKLIEKLEEHYELSIDEGELESGCITISSKEREAFAFKFQELVLKNQLKIEVPRYLPLDYRYSNYLLAQRLFRRAALKQSSTQEAHALQKAAYELQDMSYTVHESRLKSWLQEPSLRRDIDYFLFRKELRCLGQATLF